MELRLMEMYVRNHRELFREKIPVMEAVCQFKYKNEKQTLPVTECPIKVGDRTTGSDHFVSLNQRLFGPIPYKGDDVSLFMVLTSLTVKDYAEVVVNALTSMSKVCTSAELKVALTLVEPISQTIKAIQDQLEEPLISAKDSFTPGTDSVNPIRSGFWVMINKEYDEVKPETLWIKNNRLMVGASASSLRVFEDADYFLFFLNTYTHRSDWETLSEFSESVPKMKQLALEGNLEELKKEFIGFRIKLINSHDITDDDAIGIAISEQAELKRLVAVSESTSSLFSKGAMTTDSLEETMGEAKSLFSSPRPPPPSRKRGLRPQTSITQPLRDEALPMKDAVVLQDVSRVSDGRRSRILKLDL
jgi:hypothetical protein